MADAVASCSSPWVTIKVLSMTLTQEMSVRATLHPVPPRRRPRMISEGKAYT